MKKLTLCLAPLAILLSSCSWIPEKEIVTETKLVKPNIPVVPRPRSVDFGELNVVVITEDNLQEVIDETKQSQGDFVMYGLSPLVFKNLALGIEELKRYITQSNEIIEYYEKAVTCLLYTSDAADE